MRKNRVLSQELSGAPTRFAAWFSLGVLSCTAVFSGGCSVVRKKPSLAWGTAIQARPVPVRELTPTDLADSIPDLYLILSPPPSPIVTVAQPIPVRPHAAVTTASGSVVVGKPEAPVIVPQLTVEEAGAAKQQANQSLGIAEKNLAVTHGKNLSPAQADLVSKIRSFLSDARDAARASDWIRARDLAKKAQVLSEELVHLL